VRGDGFKLSVSEYDLVLGIASDGTYRIMPPPEKVLFTGKLIHCAPFDPDAGAEFTVVYRDAKKIAFAKRIRIERFIRNKEYRLVKDKGGRVDWLLPEGETGTVDLTFVPAKRQRIKSAHFDLSELQPTSPTARGTRLAPKPVSKVKFKRGDPAPPSRRKAPARKSPPETEDDGQAKLL
jgi:hypothetical protein